MPHFVGTKCDSRNTQVALKVEKPKSSRRPTQGLFSHNLPKPSSRPGSRSRCSKCIIAPSLHNIENRINTSKTTPIVLQYKKRNIKIKSNMSAIVAIGCITIDQQGKKAYFAPLLLYNTSRCTTRRTCAIHLYLSHSFALG